MHKLEFFLKALKAKAYQNKSWTISAFAIIHEDKDKWKSNPYPYRVVQTPSGSFFVDPENNMELTPIEGYSLGSPIFTFKDRIELKAGDLLNLKQDIVSTLGNVLFNQICLVYGFGDKIPFINKRVVMSNLENYIASKLEDTPKKEEDRQPDRLYVDEYLRFVNAVFDLTNFTQLCVWGATEKVISAPPGIAAFKKKLIEENKDRITDSTVIANIDKALVAYDAEYLKGDPGENFLLSNKSRSIVRKKKFLMYGAEPGLDDSVKLDPITNSLEEGWDISKFPAMNNALRAGSFNRGAQTELGGESVKWLLRASSNIIINSNDCGTTVGKPFAVTQSNHKKLVDFSIVTEDGHKLIENEEESGQYIGKYLMVRSPMYCKLDKTDYCKVCVGKKLAQNPTGLSMVVSEYGSSFLSIFMSAAHAKQLSLQKMDLHEVLS